MVARGRHVDAIFASDWGYDDWKLGGPSESDHGLVKFKKLLADNEFPHQVGMHLGGT